MAAKMSEKTKRVWDEIMYEVESARATTYEEWLGKTKDSPSLRKLFRDKQNGIIRGYWDGRTLAALERRGLIKYFDNMERDCWEVYVIEK